MKNLLSYIRHKQDLIYKIILVLICISTIVYLLPKESKFKYEFQQGKPWLHENLIAPFDFAIYKTEKNITKEKKDLETKTKLYFTVNDSVPLSQKIKFKEKFSLMWPQSQLSKKKKLALFNHKNSEKLFKQHIDNGLQILSEIYRKGIIESNDVLGGKSIDYSIVVVENNYEKDKELSSFYTLQTAFNFLNKKVDKLKDTDPILLKNVLESVLKQNVLYDAETTHKIVESRLEKISLTRGGVLMNEKIIDKGDLITPTLFLKLNSLKIETEKHQGIQNEYLIIIGQIILVTTLVMIIMIFIAQFRKDIYQESDKVAFILLMVLLMAIMSTLPEKLGFLNINVLPFCILPIILRSFFDIRLATFTHFIAIVLVGYMAPNSYEFVFIQFVAGAFAVFSIVNLNKRSQLFKTSAIIFVSYSVTYVGMSIIKEGDLNQLNLMNFVWFGINAALTLSIFPLMYVFEKSFNFLSDVTLMELSDTNSPLLRMLSEQAPGTFQHSMQVANLAEEAVRYVGGNPLLVRTGALYHDIGKMYNPAYFIENQIGINPHDELTYQESTAIIIEHVIKGIEKAKKHKLPNQIIDFIRTHHGTTTTQYFYRLYSKEHPEEVNAKSMFTYPGPIPFSKETAILMMADSVEAASKSLKEPTAEKINLLVGAVIDGQVKGNQFVNSPITFKDVIEIKKIFSKKLMSIYHVRVAYPD